MKRKIVVLGMLGLLFLGSCVGSQESMRKNKLSNTADAPHNQQRQR